MKRFFFIFSIAVFAFAACTKDKIDDKDPDTQVTLKVAYDANYVAFQYTWFSQAKSLPAGFGNNGQVYPGHIHDVLKHNGTKFDRLPSTDRMQEDRVTFMIQQVDGAVEGFDEAGCWVSCHEGMEDHNLLQPGVLDHWHWRGGRSGPMGYAEDAGVNETSRIRDDLGTSPTAFLRSGGDRLRENQAALANTSNANAESMPRFVFNKGKNVNGFTYPKYFIADEAGNVITNPHTEIPTVKDVSKNRSLLVIYQDLTFDPVNKINAIDLGYLVWVASGNTTVAHIPAHLANETDARHTTWKNFWATELNIATTAAAAAQTKLDEIHAEWVASGNNAMIARSVGFIYNSGQHDITSKHEFDTTKGKWTVTLYRKLNTGETADVNLSGLASGTKYSIGFAMHDAGGAAVSHDLSLPYIMGTGFDTDIKPNFVGDVKTANWNSIEALNVNWVKQDYNWTYEELTGGLHAGAASVGLLSCQSCHNEDGTARVLTNNF